MANKIKIAVQAIQRLRAQARRTNCHHVEQMCNVALGEQLSNPPTQDEQNEMLAALRQCQSYL